MTRQPRAETLFRRAWPVVANWDGRQLCVRNYVTRTVADVDQQALSVLDALSSWQSVRSLRRRFPSLPARTLADLLMRLSGQAIVESSDGPSWSGDPALNVWAEWAHSASYFHFQTRNASYVNPADAAELLRQREALDPLPAPVKTIDGPTVELPAFPRHQPFPSVLLSRRSWRRFGRTAITVDQLAALLRLTWATQSWVHLSDRIRVPLKTSPSGGACHSLEVYVAVRRVKGLERGVYHYCHDSHSLRLLKHRWTVEWIGRCLAGQDWFASASVVVFMTAVFPRVMWKYRGPRSYRTVLIEAGHFCQTFCLTATWLGLAPFCTAALSESHIERAIGVDGITESVLYAAGVGTRPRGTAWAPYPHTSRTPATSPPAFEREGRTRD